MQPEANSYLQGPTTQPLLEETIGQCLDRMAHTHPERDAIVVRHQGIRWTYSDYLKEINRLATGLLNLGIKPGDRVGIWAPNRVEWCLTQFATAKIGAIMVCINPAYRLYELEYALNKVECNAIITAESFKTSHYLDMLNQLAPELKTCAPGQLQAAKLPHLKTVIRMGDDNSPGMFNFDQVCRMGTESDYARLQALSHQLKPTDPINIQFTSGTSGSPKVEPKWRQQPWGLHTAMSLLPPQRQPLH